MPHFLKIKNKQIFCAILFLTNCNIKSAYFTQEPKFEEVSFVIKGNDGVKDKIDVFASSQWDYLSYKLIEQKRNYEDLVVVYKLSHDTPWYGFCKDFFEKSDDKVLKDEKDKIVAMFNFLNLKKESVRDLVKKKLQDFYEKKRKRDKKVVVESEKNDDGLIKSLSSRVHKEIERYTNSIAVSLVSGSDKKNEEKQFAIRKRIYKKGFEDEIFVFATKQEKFYFSIFGKLIEENEIKSMIRNMGKNIHQTTEAGKKAKDKNGQTLSDGDQKNKNICCNLIRNYMLTILFLSWIYVILNYGARPL